MEDRVKELEEKLRKSEQQRQKLKDNLVSKTSSGLLAHCRCFDGSLRFLHTTRHFGLSI